MAKTKKEKNKKVTKNKVAKKKVLKKKVVKKKVVKKKVAKKKVVKKKVVKKKAVKKKVATKKVTKKSAAKKKAKKTSKKITGQKESVLESSASEDMSKLIALGRMKGELTLDEINDALPKEVTTTDEMENVLSIVADNKIKIVDKGTDELQELEDKAIEHKKLTQPAGIEPSTRSSSDDPVKMYLRQMGQIPLLSREQEISLAERIKTEENMFRKIILSSKSAKKHIVDLLKKFMQKTLVLMI